MRAAVLGRPAVLAFLLAGWTDAARPDELREFRLEAPGRPDQLTTLAQALAWRLAEAGISATAAAVPECPEVRVSVDPSVAPDRVRAALTRPFGRLEVRPVASSLPAAECAATRRSGQLCVTDPEAAPGQGSSLLVEPGMTIEEVALELAADALSGMPRLLIRLGVAEAERLCSLTGESIGGRVALVADGEAITAPYVVEPICTGALALSGGEGGAAGMAELERQALRVAASMLPPPVILREALVDRAPTTADGPAAPPACAVGRPAGSR